MRVSLYANICFEPITATIYCTFYMSGIVEKNILYII